MLMSNSTGVIDESIDRYARHYNDKNFPQKYDLIFERLPFGEAGLQKTLQIASLRRRLKDLSRERFSCSHTANRIEPSLCKVIGEIREWQGCQYAKPLSFTKSLALITCLGLLPCSLRTRLCCGD